MSMIILPAPGAEQAAADLAVHLQAPVGRVEARRFPDGESYLRLHDDLAGQDVVVVASLRNPDPQALGLWYLAQTARELGARGVGIVAPYLPYLRQDKRFQPGEALTSVTFARFLSQAFDWLVTVDPHLHRITDLAQVYSIPSRVIHAAPDVAAWVRANVRQPLLVGPDEESAQWVQAVARGAGAPFVILAKERRGDRDVVVSVPDVERWRAHTPVLVDDIVSTARTMIETVGHLRRAGLSAPTCVAVHAIFAGSAIEDLRAAGAADIVSCDTIVHASNRIPLATAIGAGVREMLAGAPSRAGS